MNTKAIFEAKQALNKFLNENPHLKEQQAKLDFILNNAGNSTNRIAILTQLLRKNLYDLRQACGELDKLFRAN